MNIRKGSYITKIYNLPDNCRVFVYKVSRLWTGLYKLLSIEGKFAIISLPSRPTKFSTTIVRFYCRKVEEKEKREDGKNIESPGSHNDDEETANCESGI